MLYVWKNEKKKKITPKEIRREAQMFDTDMIMGCMDRKWLLEVCEAQNRFLHEIAERLEEEK